MDYTTALLGPILKEINRDPLQPAVWSELMVICMDQKDLVALESYQIITEVITHLTPETLPDQYKNRAGDKALLSTKQREFLGRLAVSPTDARMVGEFGIMLVDCFDMTETSFRLFDRASELDPSNVDWRQWAQHAQDRRNPAPPHKSMWEAEKSLPTPTGGGGSGGMGGGMGSGSQESGERPTRVRGMFSGTSTLRSGIVSTKPPSEDELPKEEPKPSSAPGFPTRSKGAEKKDTKEDDKDSSSNTRARIPSEGSIREHFNSRLTSIQCRRLDELAPVKLETKENDSDGDTTRSMLLVMSGYQLHKEGQRDKALKCYQEALHLTPDVPSILFYIGTIFHEWKRYTDAAIHYSELLHLMPQHDQAWGNLAAMHFELDEFEPSFTCLRKALDLQPGRAAYWNELATLHMETGKYAEAREAVSKVLEIEPEQADALIMRGLLYYQENDHERAAEDLAAGLVKPSDSPLGYCHLALSLIRLFKPAEAYEAMMKTPETQSLRELQLSTWKTLAFALEKAQFPGRAASCLQHMSKLDPENTSLVYEAAALARKSRDFESARSVLMRLAARQPEDPRPHWELGLTYYRGELFAEAAECFLKAADLDPQSADWPYNAGVALQKLGRIDDAMAAYRRASAPPLDHISAMFNLALILLQDKKGQEATTYLEQVTVRQPYYSAAWHALGLARELTEDWTGALAALEKKMEMDGSDPETATHAAQLRDKITRQAEEQNPTPLPETYNPFANPPEPAPNSIDHLSPFYDDSITTRKLPE